MISLRQLHSWLVGSTLFGNPDAVITRVHTDTRSIQAGDLYVALSGDQFDGNAFVEEAVAKDAVAVIAKHGLKSKSIQGLEVTDTKLALGIIAGKWRAQFDIPLIAVTGSNGKTTVTQMLASILRAHTGEQSLATIGNSNNDIGVPLTLLRLRQSHKIAVVELGMNHPGEIAYLSNIVKPTVVLVNNAQREHLEFMVSVDAVAHENGSAISALPESGIAVYPQDEDYSAVWKTLAGQRRSLTFSMNSEANNFADVFSIKANWLNAHWQVTASTPKGEINYSLAIAGRHNVKNSLAAVACALAANIPIHTIATGLQDFSAVKGRSFTQSIRINGCDVLLIDDSYNSNPDSMNAAINSLSDMPEPRLIVMGDMGEVGEQGLAFHAEVGEYAKIKGVQQLFALGALSQEAVKHFKGARHFETIDSLLAAVVTEVGSAKSILVKGSRFMKMERVSLHIASLATNDKNFPNLSTGGKDKNNMEVSHVA